MGVRQGSGLPVRYVTKTWSVVLLNKKIHILLSQVYCVCQVVKPPTIILNNPVFKRTLINLAVRDQLSGCKTLVSDIWNGHRSVLRWGAAPRFVSVSRNHSTLENEGSMFLRNVGTNRPAMQRHIPYTRTIIWTHQISRTYKMLSKNAKFKVLRAVPLKF